MSLVAIRELSIGFGGPPLLDRVSCQIRRGQRIGLLGRNGAGKTTLMRILCGQAEPDEGGVVLAAGVRISLLPQETPAGVAGPVRRVVAGGAPPPGDPESAWRGRRQVESILSRMELNGDLSFDELSSGMKRRVLLARALAAEPDLLLLDEPTNHLDIDAIEWLERFLGRWDGTLMFVTHDRMFLRKLADRIVELDRGKLFDWSCDYDTFLQRKEAALAAEEKQNLLFDKALAREEAWIRQGIKARRTRNEGRVRALRTMRRERQQRRTADGKVRMELHQELRSGNIVAQLENVSFAYGGQQVIRDFSTTIMRGDKIGVIGPNGAGKTTLLRLLVGQLTPTQGGVRLGVNLQFAYFDQLREQLNEQRTVAENVGDGCDTVSVCGKKQHIIGYLQDFLFTPERARTLVKFLSGGERNRALLARLFAKPANVVVLDEPTNDLDAETLELLEELLVEYEGTVLLVSHDRAFLNNVVGSTIVFERGQLKEYVGGYDDWLRQRSGDAAGDDAAADTVAGRERAGAANRANVKSPSREAGSRSARRRLTYKQQQELAALPAAIERLEAQIAALHQAMAAPGFYKRPGEEIAREKAALQQLEAQLVESYGRWEELEAGSQPP